MSPVFVHAVGTSGRDRAARKRHAHAAQCMQCGCQVDERTRVAAHVVRYRLPLLCPCAGTLTLVTTCRACNGKHQARDDDAGEPCCVPRARMWRRRAPHTESLGQVRTLWCWRHRRRDA